MSSVPIKRKVIEIEEDKCLDNKKQKTFESNVKDHVGSISATVTSAGPSIYDENDCGDEETEEMKAKKSIEIATRAVMTIAMESSDRLMELPHIFENSMAMTTLKKFHHYSYINELQVTFYNAWITPDIGWFVRDFLQQQKIDLEVIGEENVELLINAVKTILMIFEKFINPKRTTWTETLTSAVKGFLT